MTDMTAFERQVAGEMLGRAGPVRPVDDLAVFESVTAASRSQTWGFTMFSALKFIAAGVIVALFGGFLLTGILTTQQGDEMAPAAVTESPSPMTTEELLSGMVTEEVEPGVYKVLNDGVRDLQPFDTGNAVHRHVVAGQDGSVWWLAGSNHLLRLGVAETADRQLEDWDSLEDLEIAYDGTVWAIAGYPRALRSFDGETWTIHRAVDGSYERGNVEIAPDGVVWAALADGTLGYLDLDGSMWQTIELPTAFDADELEWNGFIATESEVWASSQGGVWHYADGTWEYIPYGGVDTGASSQVEVWPDEGAWEYVVDGGPDAGAMPDNVFWALGGSRTGSDETLHRHDGTGWQGWSLKEQGMTPYWGAHPDEYAVAPDGSFWTGWTDRSDGDCEGVNRFDGQTWMRYLPGMCPSGVDIAPDGSVWLVAREWDDCEAAQGPEPGPYLYVITPEAMTATE